MFIWCSILTFYGTKVFFAFQPFWEICIGITSKAVNKAKFRRIKTGFQIVTLILTSVGEHMTEEELAECFATLLGFNVVEGHAETQTSECKGVYQKCYKMYKKE